MHYAERDFAFSLGRQSQNNEEERRSNAAHARSLQAVSSEVRSRKPLHGQLRVSLDLRRRNDFEIWLSGLQVGQGDGGGAYREKWVRFAKPAKGSN